MGIRSKLGFVSALLLVPIALLAWLFIDQSLKDIRFAEKERNGAVYLRGAWSTVTGLIDATDISAGKRTASSPAHLDDLAAAYAADMEATDSAQALNESLKVIGWPRPSIARNEKSEKAIADARALLSKIADGSNLTLDPDLDSYYVMDAVTTKLPEVVDRSSAIMTLIEKQRHERLLTDDDKSELMIQLGLLGTATSGTVASLESGYKGNLSGETRAHLEKLATSFSGVSEKLAAELKSLAIHMRDDTARAKLDLAPIAALNQQAAAASDALWQASAQELDRLLGARIAGFKYRLWLMLGTAAAVTLAALGMAFFVSNQISGPLLRMKNGMTALASGRYDIALPGLGRRDEIGEISRTLDGLKNTLADADKIRAEQAEHEAAAERQRRSDMAQLADRIRASVGTIVGGMNRLSGTVSDATKAMQSNAISTCDQVEVAMTDLGKASGDVSTVAAAVSELASSIKEISSQTVHSTTASTDVAAAAQVAQQVVDNLTITSRRIGDISNLINSIAAQTNLLALNATIEAARAGEAGRGFAVVASEVKSLASQTARATEDIDRQVAEIQKASEDAVAAVQRINSTITSVKETSTSIAGAVEEQNAATEEISESVQRAASGTRSVIDNIANLPSMANQMKDSATSLADLTVELGNQSSMLDSEINRLLRELTERRAYARYESGCALTIAKEGRSQPAKLVDISETGACIGAVPAVAVGDAVSLTFPDGAEVNARVMWKANGQIGAEFTGQRLDRIAVQRLSNEVKSQAA